ncbi:MAG: type II toxin-antitoxin system HigB family toxin [Bryobacteraceae bacterium]|jgi:mRNA interferase HigB
MARRCVRAPKCGSAGGQRIPNHLPTQPTGPAGSIYGNLKGEDRRQTADSGIWNNPGALKADFGSAGFVGDLTVFNLGGNQYRLVAFVHHRRQIVYIKHILTHEEYDGGQWKL